ncbi:MAG: hypothetical protein R3A11_04655 [Bdellovibrionota bacterium]
MKTSRMVTLLLLAFFLVLEPTHIGHAQFSGETLLLNKEAGLFTCSGGGSGSALFIQDCKEVTVKRAGQGPKYEGTCLDSNSTKFVFACEAFVFEPGKTAEQSKTSYTR